MAARVGETLHVRAVQDIARQRFRYPSDAYPTFRTFTNVPQRTMAIADAQLNILYPDIVVVQWPERITQILGQVETNNSLGDQQAPARWRAFARAGPLYLYVPVGRAEETKRLIKRHKISTVGLRTWRYIVGYEAIEIVDMETAPSDPLEALMPKALRRLLPAIRPPRPGPREAS